MSLVDEEPSTKPKTLVKQRGSRQKKRSVWTRQKLPRVYFGSPRDRKKSREVNYERKQRQVIDEVLQERQTNANHELFESSDETSSEGEQSDSEVRVPRESAPKAARSNAAPTTAENEAASRATGSKRQKCSHSKPTFSVQDDDV